MTLHTLSPDSEYPIKSDGVLLEGLLMKKKITTQVDPFIQALLPEDDGVIKKQIGVGSTLALAAAVWASTITFTKVADILIKRGDQKIVATMDIKEMPPKPDKKKPQPKKVRDAQAGKSGQMGSPKEPKHTRPEKNNMMSQTLLAILSRESSQGGLRAIDLLKEDFSKDIAKDLDRTATLVKSGNTTIGAGTRREHLSVGYNINGSHGNGDQEKGLGSALTEAIGGIGGTLGGGKIVGLSAPKPSTIDMGPGSGSRSKASIMRVIRSRMPGLRHVFNKALKEKPGFQGKVTLKMTISPSGKIIKISKVSSTTGYSSFDNQVLKRVKSWKFEKIKSGNTTVTIPFTFSE